MIEPKFTAHRGRVIGKPCIENTLEAIKASIEHQNIDAIEIDIRQTKDGVFVLMNYQTLGNVMEAFDSTRTQISDFTYEELCKMNFHGNTSEMMDIFFGDKLLEFDEYGIRILNYYEKIVNKTKITKLEDVLS